MPEPKWLTIRQALARPGAPKRRAFYDKAKKKPRPKFFRSRGGQLFVNVASEEYAAWHGEVKAKRQTRAKSRATREQFVMDEIGQRGDESGYDPADPAGEFDRLKCLKLGEEIREKRIKNQILEIKLRKENYGIIEWDLATYLFFGYLERLNNSLLKLDEKVATVINNLVQEGDADAIIKRYKREHTSLIKEIKKAQAADLKNWKAETGADV